MKPLKLKWVVTIIIILAITLGIQSMVLATNEEIQILKKSDSEFILYLKNHMESEFEFSFSNDQPEDVVKENLRYRKSGTDSIEDGNHIVYIDSELYTTYFSKPTYLWARTLSGEYFAEGIEIDLNDFVTDEDVEFINNMTEVIEVDTTNTLVTEEEIDDVKITRTIGKIDIKEEGTTYYQIVNLPASEEYNEFMEIAETIANNQIPSGFYERLEITNEFMKLYNQLVPAIEDANWIEVTDNTILQPEDSEEGEQYIVWLKNEQEGEETKIDVQFMTSFEDYKQEVINEQITTKLPVTYDNPILFILLAVLVILFIALLGIKAIINRKKVNTKGEKNEEVM